MGNRANKIYRALTNTNNKLKTRTIGRSNWMGFGRIQMVSDFDTQLQEIQSTFENFDTADIEKNISAFNSLDLEHVSDTELRSIISSIVPATTQTTLIYPNNTELYRARKYALEDDKGVLTPFRHSKELWCAPPEYIGMGRLNNKGEQILYTSTDALTPIHEIRSEEDTEFALIKYKVKSPSGLKLTMIGYDYFEHNNKGRKEIASWSPVARKNWSLLNSFIQQEFTKAVPQDKPYLYRSTLILKELFEQGDCDGFIYPSVEKADGLNIAIKAKSVGALTFAGLSYWKNKSYNKKELKGADLWCRQAWSDRLNGDEIKYHLHQACEIEFKPLKIAKDKYIPSKNRLKPF